MKAPAIKRLIRSFFASLALCASVICSPAQAVAKITDYNLDPAGTPLLSTGTTSGAVIWKENHLPYGDKLIKQPAATNNTIGYAGKPYDNATGLSYMGARYYNPTLGRFTGIDPVGFNPDNLHSHNRYAYANNNPYKYVDPDGRIPLPLLALVPQGVSSLTAIAASFTARFAATRAFQIGMSAAYAETGFVAPTIGAGIAAGKVASVVAKEAGVVANGVRGRASETRVLSEMGLQKNTKTVTSAEGKAIPDALTETMSIEVKDAARVTLTKQLRIQTEAASAAGRESVLITGENTCISSNCTRAFDIVIPRIDLGPR